MTDLDEELSVRRVGRTVGGRWLLERVLGVGGMATVYAARDASGSIAAIKILHPEMSVRREVRDRFLREGYVANHIGHPGVVRALEHGETGDEVFLAMELLAGETLRERVKRHGRLPIGEVLDYSEQILDVLALAHDRGVVHRDLKPDNLFVGADGRIKILDFGLARVLEGVPSEHRTRTGVALGTLAYMAPEQALGRRAEIDGRVDIFALGATMFRVLSGRRVHEAESEAELLMAMASRPAPPLASVLPGIGPAVAGVVDLALAFSRDARYPDARTMQNDVRALRRGELAPYASARLSSREEATRAELPSTQPQPHMQRTQPLAVTASGIPGTSSTVPMPVASMGVVAAAPGFGPAFSAPPQGPASVRTAPLSVPGGHPGAPLVATPPASSFATTMPSTQPPTVVPAFATSQPVVTAPAKGKGSFAIMVLVGLGLLAVAGGAAAWYFVAGPGAHADAAVASPSAAAPGAPSGATVVAETPEAPAPAGADTTASDVSSPAHRAPGKKADAPGAPSASTAPGATASAAVAPTAAPTSSDASPAAPASPSASAASPASPAAPAPPAPPPAPPSPSPSTAPASPAPPAPATPGAKPPPGPKGKGRGRGKGG